MTTLRVKIKTDSANSLVLLHWLSQIGETEWVDQSTYDVTGSDNEIRDVTNEFPQCIMKIEAV